MSTLPRRGLCFEPPEYDDATIAAIRAVKDGTANAGQQKRAWDWIVYHAAAYNELSFQPEDRGGERATVFMEGRRFVGSQMLKMLQPILTPAPVEPPKRKRGRPRKVRDE